MQTSSIVRLHAIVSIEQESWPNFKFLLDKTKQIVNDEGTDVLTHVCYRQPGTNKCLIVEAYKSESAFLLHLQRISSTELKLVKIGPKGSARVG